MKEKLRSNISIGAPNCGSFISAYKNGTKKVVVAIHTGSADVKQKISFLGASATSVIPYLTTSSKNAEQESAITLANNSFNYTIPFQSVVSFVEQ